MAIDNAQQVESLMQKMEASLPIPIRGTPELFKALDDKGDQYRLDHEFLIEKIFYAGDEGGILCCLEPAPDEPSVCVSSLTHLRIGDDHPLAEEIKDYQRKRVIGLALQHGKRGKAMRLAKKGTKKKGFG
jgi:hypothetical protein